VCEALPDDELEGRPGAALRVEHPVDLPLGEQALVLPARLRPVGELRQAAELPGEPDALLERPLQPLLSHGDVEAGLTERRRERAERVPVERFRRHRAPARVEVLRGRYAAEL